jgi:hypothetical protein
VVDIRTLPFVRFDDNECHSDGRYGFNLGEGVNRAGPDARHPFVVRNLKIWEVHYAMRPQSPCLLAENVHIHRADYGVYHPNYDHHVYRNMTIGFTNTEPFNRGHDDASVQYGPLAVDGLTFDGIRSGGMPLIQITDDNPSGTAEAHFRRVAVTNWTGNSRQRSWVNLGGGPRPKPKTPTSVPVYIHDYFGPGQHAKVTSVKSQDQTSDGVPYREVPDLTGNESRAAEVRDVKFPEPLTPVDDLPPATVITHVSRLPDGKLLVRGTTCDNGEVRRVLVNDQAAVATTSNFAEWSIELSSGAQPATGLVAFAEDAAGNKEQLPHRR